MVTTSGIDPHKSTHTAVAIGESETVLGELTVPADRYQTTRLLDWAGRLNGNGRIWAVEAAGGLGYLLSQQLVVSGEEVVDVPPVLASRIRVLSSGKSDKNDTVHRTTQRRRPQAPLLTQPPAALQWFGGI